VTVEIENWVREYYQYADWDYKTGMPSLRKLIQLGLAEVAKDFYEEASLRQMKLYKNKGL
jgi:hypothetical protein